MEKKLYISQPGFCQNCPEAVQLLKEHGFSIDSNDTSYIAQRSFLEQNIHQYHAVIAGTEQWDAALFEKAVNLRIIARFGSGLDSVDLQAADAAGVRVTAAVGMNAASVANMTIGLMLSCLRKITAFHEQVKQGKWPEELSSDLDGKKIGLLGFGNVAQQVAQRLLGFPVQVCAYDLFPNEQKAAQLHVKLTSLEEIAESCDIISVHLPALEQTHHIINREWLSKMKSNAILINTSRGKLVDTEALCEALKNGRIGGAGIDVYEQEPVDRHHPLLSCPNVVLTPHTSGLTREACYATGMKNARDIIAFWDEHFR